MPVSIGGSENPGNRICAIFLPPQYSCELYDSGLERYRTLKKQSKKTRMLQSMHSQLFVVLLYQPPAGSGCCRISCRYSLVLQKMPGIDGAGSQYKTNRRAPAVAGYPTGSPRCTGKLCQPAGFGRCRFACKLTICRKLFVCRIHMVIRHSAYISSGRYNISTLYNYRTNREYNTLRNGDHCSPDIRACKTWNAKKREINTVIQERRRKKSP